MNQLTVLLAIIAGIIAITSLYSKKIEQSFISEPMIPLIIGFLLNISDISLFNLQDEMDLIDMATRLTLIVGLISTALRLPHRGLMNYKKDFTLIVLIGMTGMWILASAIVKFILGLDILHSLLLGAVLTPTDPVVISSIVSGEKQKKMIPEKVRNIISFDSGANDGLAFLMVMLPLFLIIKPTDTAFNDFFYKVLLIENLTGILIAAVFGLIAGKLLHKAHEKQTTNQQSMLGFSIAAAFLIYGICEVLHLNSIIAVFTAGISMNAVISENEKIEEEKVPEIMERLFVMPIFFLLGLVVPWREWLLYSVELIGMLLLITFVKRIPVILALKPILGKDNSFKDLLLIGWFGPLGVAALFYAVYVYNETDFILLWPVVSFVVFGSVIIHGITRYYVSRWYSNSK